MEAKWIALSNTTLGALMASINGTMLLIALPAIFNGIGFNPNQPDGITYLIWLIMGYMIVTAVLLVTFGKLSDIYGRVRLYRLGFAIFTAASILLYIISLVVRGDNGVLALIIVRILQGVGGGFLFANSAAILTDYFPVRERGKSLGINQVSAVAGSFIGLVVGGVLASYDWHLVFLFNVPFGIVGTVWSYISLRDVGKLIRARIDIIGNVLFAAGLSLLLIGITYGLLPYGSSSTGWGNPFTLVSIISGVVLLLLFVYAESKIKNPMFELGLFRIRDFASGNIANLVSSLARQGLMLTVVIFLQGIWLPIHGYSYSSTPFWSGVYLIPFMLGFVILGPISGFFSDKFGGKILTTSGLAISALGFIALSFLPYNFDYVTFASILFIIGAAQGMFAAPNTADIMSSVAEEKRGVASGMRATLMNSAGAASLAFYFTIIITSMSLAFLSNSVMYVASSLQGVGLPPSQAVQISQDLSAYMPSASTSLFSALLGYNPTLGLLSSVGSIVPQNISADVVKVFSSSSFFPNLVGSSFIAGFKSITYISAGLLVVAAIIAFLREGKRRDGRRFMPKGKSLKT